MRKQKNNGIDAALQPQEDLETKQNNSGRHSAVRIIGFSAILLAFFVAIAFVLSDMGLIKTKQDESKDVFFSVSSDSVSSMAAYGNGGIAVLTDTAVRYFDSFGNSVNSNDCSYANPVMHTAGNNLILFERGGYSLRIEKKGTIFTELTVTSVITTASISKSGSYAYVLDDCEGFQSHLYMFNNSGKKTFEWGSSGDYIVDAPVSDDGKKVCVAVIGGSNAEIFSKIILFGINSEKPVFEVSLPSAAVYSVSFVSGKSVAAYTDKGVYLINSKGECTPVQEYAPSEMKLSSNLNSGLGATAINRYGDDKNVLFTVFSKKYGVAFTKEFTEAVKAVHSSEKYAAIVFADRIEVYRGKDVLVNSLETGAMCLSSIVSGRYVFALFSDGIKSFRIA